MVRQLRATTPVLQSLLLHEAIRLFNRVKVNVFVAFTDRTHRTPHRVHHKLVFESKAIVNCIVMMILPQGAGQTTLNLDE